MLVIARHGRTQANAERRLLGSLDVPLDELGRAQAATLPAAVGPVDRVVSSPLTRALDTAASFGLPVEVDVRFREIDYGEYDGLRLADVPRDLWVRWRGDPSFAPPGGESLAAVRIRVAEALDDLAGAAGRETIVVVAHVSPIKAAMAWALGAGDDVVWRMFVSPASISRIAVVDGAPVLHSFNEVTHLAALADFESG